MKLETILLADDVVSSINNNLDYLLEIIPEIKYIIGFDHKHPHHHLDVWNHTLLALSMSKKDFDIRLALLLHDIGKPFSYQEGEIRHFKGHPLVSSNMAINILYRLGYDEDYIAYIGYLVKHHDTPINNNQLNNNLDICFKLFEIQRCDALAHHPDKLERRKKYLEETNKKLVLRKEQNEN